MGSQKNMRVFDKGRSTPQEYHAKNAFPLDAKCTACQAKPSIRAIVMMPLDEAEKRNLVPAGAAKAPYLFPALQPVLVHIKSSDPKGEWYIRISLAYSCTMCQKAFEKALATAPSYCIVEINRGPNSSNRVASGYGS